MPITGLPSFSAGILTAAQLNAIVTALETKFAGQIVAGDIAWPLTAGGDINMAQHQLLNVGKFWNAYNAAERDSGVTFQTLITNLGNEGGGVILLPGNYTETLPTGGITVPASVMIVGEGYTSVLLCPASAGAAMLTFDTSSHNSGLVNLRMQGRTDVNHIFVDLNSCDYTRLHNVVFDTHGTQPFVKVRASALGTSIHRCRFVGNGDTNAQSQVYLDACTDTRIVNNRFENWTDAAITATPNGASVSGTLLGGNKLFRDFGTDAARSAAGAINFNNSGAVASAGVLAIDNHIWGGGAGVCGVLVNDFDDVLLADNKIHTTDTDLPAVHIYNSNRIVVNGNKILANTGDGIVIGANHGTDATASAAVCVGFVVTGNNVRCRDGDAAKGAALIICCTTSAIDGCVAGNFLESNSCHTLQVWNVSANEINLVISGNYSVPDIGSYKGFASYTDRGTTNTGNIGGTTASYWFTMVGNTIPNAASGTDYTHDATDKCIVQDNNT